MGTRIETCPDCGAVVAYSSSIYTRTHTRVGTVRCEECAEERDPLLFLFRLCLWIAGGAALALAAATLLHLR